MHKSQGQTLERVRVDLRRTFEKGQGIYCGLRFRSLLNAYAAAYVALSRATNLDTLEVRNFDPLKQGFPRFLKNVFSSFSQGHGTPPRYRVV